MLLIALMLLIYAWQFIYHDPFKPVAKKQDVIQVQLKPEKTSEKKQP